MHEALSVAQADFRDVHITTYYVMYLGLDLTILFSVSSFYGLCCSTLFYRILYLLDFYLMILANGIVP